MDPDKRSLVFWSALAIATWVIVLFLAFGFVQLLRATSIG